MHYKATIRSDFSIKKMSITRPDSPRPYEVTLQLWDTAGQERFQALSSPFYRGSQICLLVYDVNNLDSFEKLERWRDEFLDQASIPERLLDSFPFFVVGNKIDTGERQVSPHSVQRLIR